MALKPISTIEANLGIEPNGRIQKKFTHNCKIYMDKYVPYMDGTLRLSAREETNKIVYQSPYAHYIYCGIKYVMPHNGKSAYYNPTYGYWSDKDGTKVPTNEKLNYHTSGTGDHWDRRMVSVEIKQVIKESVK